MGYGKREIFGLLAVLIMIIFAVVYISIDMVNSEVRFRKETIETSGKIKDTDIYRDDYGIPHILTDDKLKAFYALGYVHAYDRYFQIELTKWAAMGRLSEIYGETHIGYDKFIRAFDIEAISKKQLENASDETKKILAFYTEGVNKYISEYQGNYSMEFGLYDAVPERWQPHIPLMIYNFHAIISSKHIYGDIVFSSMRKKLSVDKLYSILSDTDYEQVKMPFFEEIKTDSIGDKDSLDMRNDTVLQNRPISFNGYDDSFQPMFNIEEYSIFGQGACNLLAYKVVKDTTEHGILVNDRHSLLHLPQNYYPVKFEIGDKKIIAIGLVGTPIFQSGRNDSIAWGMTYLQGDDINYHTVSVDENKMVYSWDDVPTDSTLSRIEVKIDTLKIKNKADVYYYQQIADNRYILPEGSIFDIQSHNGTTKSLKTNKNIVPEWVAEGNSDHIRFFSELILTDNYDQIKDITTSVYSYPTAHLGIVTADGSIFSARLGDTLVYMPELSDKKPINGNSKSIGEGLIELTEDRLISSSFDKDLKSSYFYNDNSRKDRLSNLIDESVKFSYREADMISQDLFSGFYYEFSEKIVDLIKDNTTTVSGNLQAKLDTLKQWNGIANTESYEYNLLYGLMKELHSLYIVSLFDKRVANYLWQNGISDRIILNLLSSEKYWEEFNLKEIDLLRIIVSYLENYRKERDYISTYTIPSTFGGLDNDTNILDKAYIVEVDQIRGNIHAVSYFNDRTEIPTGISYRLIADMATDKVQVSMPGGTSGNLNSPYYDNLVQFWKIGGTVSIDMESNTDNMILQTGFK
jgi:penicillin amidase